MQITLKRLHNGNWLTTTEDIAVIDQYQGTEAVAKINDQLMWCGNQKWYDYYLKQGYMVTTTKDLVELLKLAHSIFWENREERIAIMTTEGMSESDANRYCDSRPAIYGESGAIPQIQQVGKRKGQKEAPHGQDSSGGQMSLLC